MKRDELVEIAVREYKSFFKINPYHHAVSGEVNLHPVEAIGRLYNTKLYLKYSSTIRDCGGNIDKFIRDIFKDGFVRNAFFHYFINKFLKKDKLNDTLEVVTEEYNKALSSLSSKLSSQELNNEEILRNQFSVDGLKGDDFFARSIAQKIISTAVIDFKIVGNYMIKKVHEPKIMPQRTILLDWHDTIAFGSEVRKDLDKFIHHFKNKGGEYSLVVCSATSAAEDELEKNWREYFNAFYYIPSLSFIYESEIKEVMRKNNFKSLAEIPSGKLYTDLIKKLEANERNSIIITDSFLDRNFETSFPILTLVVPKDKKQSAMEWVDVIETFSKLGRATLFNGVKEYLKVRREYDTQSGLNFYDLKSPETNKNFRLYEIPYIKFTYFLNHKPNTIYYEKIVFE